MEYHIVELVDGELVKTPLGYTESNEDALALEGFCGCWSNWIVENIEGLENETITLSVLFDTHPTCHDVSTITHNIEGQELELLTEL